MWKYVPCQATTDHPPTWSRSWACGAPARLNVCPQMYKRWTRKPLCILTWSYLDTSASTRQTIAKQLAPSFFICPQAANTIVELSHMLFRCSPPSRFSYQGEALCRSTALPVPVDPFSVWTSLITAACTSRAPIQLPLHPLVSTPKTYSCGVFLKGFFLYIYIYPFF